MAESLIETTSKQYIPLQIPQKRTRTGDLVKISLMTREKSVSSGSKRVRVGVSILVCHFYLQRNMVTTSGLSSRRATEMLLVPLLRICYNNQEITLEKHQSR